MTSEVPFFDKLGQPVYRLCDNVFFDYAGKPRGFLVSEAVYDLRGQLRGFCKSQVMRDRMGKVIGFGEGARIEGLTLPVVNIPPVPFRNLPAPNPPEGCEPKEARDGPPRWSMMPLANMLIL